MRTIKNLIEIDIRNETKIDVLKCYSLKIEQQDFYKNGKPKGKILSDYEYYFFNNETDLNNFLKKYESLPFHKSIMGLICTDGSRYNTNFIKNNLNKN